MADSLVQMQYNFFRSISDLFFNTSKGNFTFAAFLTIVFGISIFVYILHRLGGGFK